MEACGAAVKVVGTVVDGQFVIDNTVDLELSLADAVAIATDKRGEERLRTLYDALNGVVALNDIGALAVAVGNHQRYNASAEVGNARLDALLVGQRVQLHGLFVDHSVELGRIKAREGLTAVTTRSKQHSGHTCSD